MKKKLHNNAVFCLLSLLTFSSVTHAQVKIGTTAPVTPHADAMLEVESTNKGLLIPRVSLTSTTVAAPLANHVAGMNIYNVASVADVTPGYYYNNGVKWIKLADQATILPEPWFDQATGAGATANTQNIYQMGNVGIGTSGTPQAKLVVNGAAINNGAYNAATATTIDFANSNLAYTSASPGAFTLINLKNGGTYTLAVQGTTAGTASFTAAGFILKSMNNGPTMAGKETIYTFLVIGTKVYYYMNTGF